MLVDTSGWIAFFSRSDSHHREAAALLQAAATQAVPLVTTNLVVAETQRLLLHRVGTGAALRALDAFDRSSLVAIRFVDAADHATARAWLERHGDRRVTYTAAVSFAVMQAMACRGFVGFDGDFDAAGFLRWQP